MKGEISIVENEGKERCKEKEVKVIVRKNEEGLDRWERNGKKENRDIILGYIEIIWYRK